MGTRLFHGLRRNARWIIHSQRESADQRQVLPGEVISVCLDGKRRSSGSEIILGRFFCKIYLRNKRILPFDSTGIEGTISSDTGSAPPRSSVTFDIM